MAQKKQQPENFFEQFVNRLNQPANDLSLVTGDLYERLHRLSRRYEQRERAGHTPQSPEAAHEVHGRLVQPPGAFRDAQHFYAMDAQHMHRVLVEHARHRQLQRVKAHPPTSVEELASQDESRSDQTVLALHDALLALAQRDAEAFRTCELHYFAGLTLSEIAVVTGVAQTTVTRRLQFSKAWLRTRMATTRSPQLFSEPDPRRGTALGGGDMPTPHQR